MFAVPTLEGAIKTVYGWRTLFCSAAFLLLFALAPAQAGEGSLRVFVVHPVLPVVHGVTQSIGIELPAPPLSAGKTYEVEISTESGLGVLMLDGGPAGAGRIRCRAGETATIAYRWAGPVPTEHAVVERVNVLVPERSLSAFATFSVGMDLRVGGIGIPQELLSGVATPVEITLRDAFHPDAPLAELLAGLGVTPELSLSPVPEEVAGRSTASEDAMLKRFFGDFSPVESALVYPGEFVPGKLQRGDDGRFVWRDMEGRPPSITLSSPEKFHLFVRLKSNAGGTVVKGVRSDSFALSGPGAGPAVGAVSLPGVVGSTLRIISHLAPDVYGAALGEIEGMMRDGGEEMAATRLGVYMKSLSGANPATFLGDYVLALLAYDARVDDMTSYMRNFLVGYDGYGVLVLTKSGVGSWKALPEAGGNDAEVSDGRTRPGDLHVVFPFRIGKNFVLKIDGSGKGGTSLWKVIPDGVNRKGYPQGNWRKEITVYTGRLLPPKKD